MTTLQPPCFLPSLKLERGGPWDKAPASRESFLCSLRLPPGVSENRNCARAGANFERYSQAIVLHILYALTTFPTHLCLRLVVLYRVGPADTAQYLTEAILLVS